MKNVICYALTTTPRAGSGVVRMDPLRFLAGCRTSMGAGTGGAGWASAHPGKKIRVGMAHPGNFSRGLKTSWQ